MTSSLATIESDLTSSRTPSRSGPTPSVLPAPGVTATTAKELLGGARAMLPWLVGVIPFGLVIGVTVAESSVSPLTGWATGSIIYAGSAQLATVELLDRGAAPLAIILTALIINARLLAYSGSIASHWRGTGRPFRALASYLLVDPSFAVGMDGYANPERGRSGHLHYLGGAGLLWIAWQSAILVGLTAGSGVPSWLHVEFAIPLFLVAQVVHHADNRGARAAAVVAGAAAVAGVSLPLHSGLVVAIAVGIAAALVTDRLARTQGVAR